MEPRTGINDPGIATIPINKESHDLLYSPTGPLTGERSLLGLIRDAGGMLENIGIHPGIRQAGSQSDTPDFQTSI